MIGRRLRIAALCAVVSVCLWWFVIRGFGHDRPPVRTVHSSWDAYLRITDNLPEIMNDLIGYHVFLNIKCGIRN